MGYVARAAGIAAAVIAIAAPAASAQVQQATPITPTGPVPSVPSYVGKPFTPKPVSGVRTPWAHPRMAAPPKNSVHNDAWQTDNYTQFAGPLGRNPQVLSTAFGRTCITLTFDRKGRIIGDLHEPRRRSRASTCSTRDARHARVPAAAVHPAAGRHEPRAEHDRRRVLLPRRQGPRRRRLERPPDPRHRRRRLAAPRPSSGRSPPTTRRRACSPTSGCPRCCRTRRAATGSSGARRAPSACSTRGPGSAARSCSARRSRTRSRCQ